MEKICRNYIYLSIQPLILARNNYIYLEEDEQMYLAKANLLDITFMPLASDVCALSRSFLSSLKLLR
jgi:hypothetical protein